MAHIMLDRLFHVLFEISVLPNTRTIKTCLTGIDKFLLNDKDGVGEETFLKSIDERYIASVAHLTTRTPGGTAK